MENERIRHLRKEILKISQEEFGKKLGVTKVAISMIESGDRGVTDQMRLAICNVYHVNEQWLRTGEGDMFMPDPKDELEALKRKYNLTSGAIRAIEKFCTLDLKSQSIILKYMESVVDAMREDDTSSEKVRENVAESVRSYAHKDPRSEMSDQEIHNRALEYEDQLRIEKNLTDASSPSRRTKKEA